MTDSDEATGASGELRLPDRDRQAFYFEGVENPTGTIFPDVLIDHVMAHLTGAEFKVLTYIVRRTFGFKKDADNISLDQIGNGITRRDGSVLDQGTGLSRKTAIAALKGLEAKGVIAVRKRRSKEKGNLPTSYGLRFKGQASSTALVKKGNPGGGEAAPPPVEPSRQPGATTAPAPARLRDQQLTEQQPTVRQQTEEQGYQLSTWPSGDGGAWSVTGQAAPEDEQIWALVLQEVRQQIARANYDTLLRDSRVLGREGGALIIGVPNAFTRDWLNTRFVSLLRKTVSAIAGRRLDVRCVVNDEWRVTSDE